ncbi:hypothetical protein DAMA08_000250 [Martiniozyma asiatica (nom. inval.)]|nr:hypothetical protein DAMA08_000250 [Martiniozyma asiatica]
MLFRSVTRQIRFQSSTAQDAVATAQKSTPQKFNKPKRNRDLYKIMEQDFKEITPLLDQMELKMQSRDNIYLKDFISLGHTWLNKISKVKNENSINAADHILFERAINTLHENDVLHISHFNRMIISMIQSKKFELAFNTWSKQLDYFLQNEDTFISAMDEKSGFEKATFYCNAFCAYLLSLKESGAKLDFQLAQSLLQNFYFSERLLSIINRKLNLSEDELNFIRNEVNQLKSQNFDINSSKHLKEITKLSHNHRLIPLEHLIDESLQKFKSLDKLSEIKPKVFETYMIALNFCKRQAKVVELFNFIQTNKLFTPTISIWNQLLAAQITFSLPNMEKRVESVWKLINKLSTPNSETFSIYIKNKIHNGHINESIQILNDLRKKNPELWNDQLKSQLIEGLMENKKSDEAFKLFKVYSEQGFSPSKDAYNKVLAHLIKNNKLEESGEILDMMINDKNVEPDTATWTAIIDFLLKTAQKSGMSSEKTISELFTIMNDMKSAGVKYNNVSIVTVIANLMRNSSTHALGLDILTEFEKTGLKLNEVGYTAVITSLCDFGDLNNALKYYSRSKENGLLPRAYRYNHILKGYRSNSDIEATKKFYETEIKPLATTGDLSSLPNQYTYFFLISQAIITGDAQFTKYVIKQLDEQFAINGDFELGQQLPQILNTLKGKGFTLGKPLALKVDKAISANKV